MKLLSIDGGGCLGVGPLYALSWFENQSGYNVSDMFDGFAGTSTGSIIAGLMCNGYSANEILNMYKEELPKIFKHRARMPWQSKYSGKPLKDCMERYFCEIKFKDLKKHLYIPYSDFENKKPRTFRKGEYDETELARAVTISCSAPTYFPPVDGKYCDGGLLVNNPSHIGGIGLAIDSGVPVSDIEVVSLGTSGQSPKPIKLRKNMGKLAWLNPLVSYWMQGNENLTDFHCRNIGFKSYSRFEPVLFDHYEMDDVNKIYDFMSVWANYYHKNEELFKNSLL